MTGFSLNFTLILLKPSQKIIPCHVTLAPTRQTEFSLYTVWPPIKNISQMSNACFPGFWKGKLMKCHWQELPAQHTSCKSIVRLLYLCRFLVVFYVPVIFQNEQITVGKWYANCKFILSFFSRCKQTKCCPESVLGVQFILNIPNHPFWKCTLNNLKNYTNYTCKPQNEAQGFGSVS